MSTFEVVPRNKESGNSQKFYPDSHDQTRDSHSKNADSLSRMGDSQTPVTQVLILITEAVIPGFWSGIISGFWWAAACVLSRFCDKMQDKCGHIYSAFWEKLLKNSIFQNFSSR